MQPPSPHGPWSPGPPPPRKTSSALVVALIVAALAFSVFVAFFVHGFRRYKERAQEARAQAARDAPLSERAPTKNGLAVMHYPANFGAKHLDDATVLVARMVGTVDESVMVGVLPIADSATDEVEEFARLMLVSSESAIEGKGGTHERGEKEKRRCLGKYPGVAYSPSFVLGGQRYVGSSCFFERKGRFHVIRIAVAESLAKDLPFLEKIAAATEFPEPGAAADDSVTAEP
jgi:hypothetical protein